MGQPAKKYDCIDPPDGSYNPEDPDSTIKIHESKEEHLQLMKSFYQKFPHVTPPEDLIDTEKELEYTIELELNYYLG